MEETAADFMIEATGIQKVYAAGGLRVRALRGVDLGVRRGRWSPSWALPDPRRQQTFVLVTHDAAVAARAHRTIRMRDGRIASDESNGKGV